jgi:hypothetical protein
VRANGPSTGTYRSAAFARGMTSTVTVTRSGASSATSPLPCAKMWVAHVQARPAARCGAEALAQGRRAQSSPLHLLGLVTGQPADVGQVLEHRVSRLFGVSADDGGEDRPMPER